MLGFWLAKGQRRFPGVELLAVCQMSNHLHLVVHDRVGQISDFMQYVLGHAAKGINRLDRLRGSVFERRFAEIVILDDEAVIRRIAYAINNPVKADLVRSHREWPGLCVFAGSAAIAETFSVFHERAYERALALAARTGAVVDREAYVETARLELAPLDAVFADGVAAAVSAREGELRRAQAGVVGAERVLSASPLDRPQMSARSAMPLCFASTRAVRAEFVCWWRAFVAAFREASSAFRRGFLAVAFPRYSFRPSTASS